MQVFCLSFGESIELRSYAPLTRKNNGADTRDQFYLPVGELQFEIDWNLHCGFNSAADHIHWVPLTQEGAMRPDLDLMQPVPSGEYFGLTDAVVLIDSPYPYQVVTVKDLCRIGGQDVPIEERVLANSNGQMLLQLTTGSRTFIETRLPNSEVVSTELWLSAESTTGTRKLHAKVGEKELSLQGTFHTDCHRDFFRLWDAGVPEADIAGKLAASSTSSGMTSTSALLSTDSSPDTLVAEIEDFLRDIPEQ